MPSQFAQLRAQHFMNTAYPNEVHGAGGDCINPKCDYVFTPQDMDEMEKDHGWFTCPQCNWTYNYLDYEMKHNRVGMTPKQMGDIGENIVDHMKVIPLLGEITWTTSDYNFPIDMIAGDFGVEVKTIHSEAQPRFKLGGGQYKPLQSKLKYVQMEGLRPALVGVRLNFYTDKADVFVRPDSFTDTWIGAPTLQHVSTIDFTNLNPFKKPEDVPPPQDLPEDDEDTEFGF